MRTHFVKFCIVGGLGTVTDMLTLFILNQIFTVSADSTLAHFIWLPGYFAAILQNYLINHFWTFKAHKSGIKPSRSALAKFALTSFISIIPRSGAYELIRLLLPPDFTLINFIVSFSSYVGFIVKPENIVTYIANFMGIVAGTIVNFFGSKYIVFKHDDN